MRLRFVWWGIGVVVLVGVGFLVVPISGPVRGLEWSPDLWRHRSFRYYQLAGIRVSPVRTSEWESVLEEYLHSEGYIPAPEGQAARWVFVHGFAPSKRGWHGPAKYTCMVFGCWGDPNEYWIRWSETHPDLARVLWPEIARLVRSGQYYPVREILSPELEAADTPEEVRQLIRRAEHKWRAYAPRGNRQSSPCR